MRRKSYLFLLIISPPLAICLSLLGLETLKNNVMGWFLFAFGIIYLAGSVVTYTFRHEQLLNTDTNSTVLRTETRGLSLGLTFAIFVLGFFMPPLEWMFFPMALFRMAWSQSVGLTFIIIAILILIWIKLQTKRRLFNYTLNTPGRPWVQSGPYRYVRHPELTSLLLMVLGCIVGYSSLVGLVVFLFIMIPNLIYQIKVDERYQKELCGEEYQVYQHHTKHLIPFLW